MADKDDIETGIITPALKPNKRFPLSFFRHWRSLTTFQRNFCYMLAFTCFLMFTLYSLPLFGQYLNSPTSQINSLFQQNVDSLLAPNADISSISEIESDVNENVDKNDNLNYDYITIDENHQTSRQEAVVSSMKHAWEGYVNFAWGHDMLKPVTRSYHEWFGLGLTLIDALDTLYIMNLTKEFNLAREWVNSQLDFNKNIDVNLFETTIRVLGGLLSTYHLSKDSIFLDKAKILADKLMVSFNTKSGIPRSDVNLKFEKAKNPNWDIHSTVSEVTSIQIEFKYLSFVTGDFKYYNAVEKVMEIFQSLPKHYNLVPQFINPDSGNFKSGSLLTLGSRADSYYEYLLKQWLLTSKTEDKYKKLYVDSVNGIIKELWRYSHPGRLAFIGEISGSTVFSPKMDHLVCFFPGTLALGYYHGLDTSHIKLAEELLYTCNELYVRTSTHLSPEIAYFNMDSNIDTDMFIKPQDAHNLLRPETIESLFYLYRITKNKTYQDWGWEIFLAFEKHAKIGTGGYSSINNVLDKSNIKYRDNMETFFLGETLKYLYLLFSEDFSLFSFDEYIFNTEAHLIPVINKDKLSFY